MREQEIKAGIARSVMEQFDLYHATNVACAIELRKAPMKWRVSQNSDEMADIDQDIWKTRGCFQKSCTEWNRTEMHQKIDLLDELINNKEYDTLQLVIRMMNMGNMDFNKDIQELDIIMGMSQIIDYLIKNQKQ